MNKKKYVIIDTDPGIDDALAILLLLKSTEVEVKAITTVAGNKDIQVVTDNAETIVKESQISVPVYSGASTPLIKKLQIGQVMGDSGLGNAKRVTGVQLNGLAVQKLVELVSNRVGEITLIALGPLTNIALAMKADSLFASKLKEIVIMGGAIESYGNMNRVAEFNFFVDPEAADIVLSSNCKKTLVTLDRCYEVPVYENEFMSLKRSKLVNFILSMVRSYIKNLALFEGQNGAIVYDALAAYYVLNPEVYETKKMDIRIETNGKLTRGMCVAERRLNKRKNLNVLVVTKINADIFKKDFLRILSLTS